MREQRRNRLLLAAWLTLSLATFDGRAGEVTVAAGGDVLLVEAPPPQCRGAVAEALAVLRGADLALANLEVSLASASLPPAAASGGLWLRADPGVAEWLAGSEIDLLSLANNHAGDFGASGLEETRARLEEVGIAPVGAGTDASCARSATVISVGGLSVAVIAAACTPPDDAMRARDPEPGVAARGGIAAIGTRRVVTLSAAKFGILAAILREAGLPLATSGTHLDLGGLVVRRGILPGSSLEFDPADIAHLRQAVVAAAATSDVVLASLHCAEPEPGARSAPAALRELAHGLVESGADAVLVHGPHMVRGAEWIGDHAVAVYGLGSLALQHRRVTEQPREAFERWLADAEP
ncbi:MAG TPA: CapA family protein, partial [Thermoanaerobaculia bacterium]|nr:CapA family protein [Thermoanaerobaculia bacterium]